MDRHFKLICVSLRICIFCQIRSIEEIASLWQHIFRQF